MKSPANDITRRVAYIALGSNLGDRAQHIASAIDRLNRFDAINVTAVSAFLDNPAVGGPDDSPPFLNAAAAIETSLSARELLNQLLKTELEMGRVRSIKWGPRVIDLDLLLYGPWDVIDEPGLSVPHPLMHTRPFVLTPLAEIAPDVIHPTLGISIRQLNHADRLI